MGDFTKLNSLPLEIRLGGCSAGNWGWGYISPVYWRNHLHVHSFFEICYAFSGDGGFFVKGDRLPVKKGQLFIARPGVEHEIISGRKRPLGIYFWSFSLDATRAEGDAGTLLREFAAADTLIAPAPSGMRRTLELLEDEAARGLAGSAEAVGGLARKLLLDTARTGAPRACRTGICAVRCRSRGEYLVNLSVRFIADNLDKPISLRDVAGQAHLTPRHLSRIFRRERGMSVGRYLRETRLEMGAKLLLDGCTTVKAAAAACGYGETRHFITAFRKRYGQTPAEYRNRRGTRHL